MRKTSKYMTKYERARILGTRALQIRFGCLEFSDWLGILADLVLIELVLILQHECAGHG